MLACPLAKFAVSFSPLKGQFVGRVELTRQHETIKRIVSRDYSLIHDLPRMIKPIAVVGRGMSREGDKVFKGDKNVGYVTSGTMLPMWEVEAKG